MTIEEVDDMLLKIDRLPKNDYYNREERELKSLT